jgi:hypothetical protein
MTDPERDQLQGSIAELKRRLRRWRVASAVLAVLFGLTFWGAVYLALSLVQEVETEQALAAQERARAVQEVQQAYDEVIRQLREPVKKQLQEQGKGQAQPGAGRRGTG